MNMFVYIYIIMLLENSAKIAVSLFGGGLYISISTAGFRLAPF